MKRFAWYVGITIGLVALLGWGLAVLFHGPRDGDAILLSAIVAVVVQAAAFAVAKLLVPSNLLVGWGAGAVIRLPTLLVYALLAVKVLALPAVAALASLAAFLFLATLIEPLFLRP